MAHEDYLTRVEDVEALRADAARTTALLNAHEATAAAATATALRVKADRAAALSTVYGDTAPSTRAEDDALAQQASTALAAWHSHSQQESAPDRSSTDIRAELDNLPPAPDADTTPHPSVVAARNELSRVDAWLDQHARSRPPSEVRVPPIAASDAELIDLARTFELPPPSPRPPGGRHSSAASGTPRRVTIGAGLALAIVGGGLVAVNVILGAAVAAIGALVAVVGLVRGRRRISRAIEPREDGVQRWAQATERCAQLGIAPDPQVLRGVTVVRAQAAALAEQTAQWQQQGASLASLNYQAVTSLAAALDARGARPGSVDREAVLHTAEQYERDCQQRADQARRASRRDVLAGQLAAVEAVEDRVARDEQNRVDASTALTGAARAAGIAADNPEQAFAALSQWLARRATQLEKASHAEREWAELRALLGDGTVADLRRAADVAQSRATGLASTNPAGSADVDPTTAADRLPALREEAAAAESKAAEAAGALAELATTLGSVTEAEEAAGDAAAELARVRELADTLATTRRFLENAQARIHREIAPVLAATVKRDLPDVTDGRYTDVIVDPTTLKVQVCGPTRRWRDAGRLSYGTAEQVYLLLRIALADHLTRGHDTCPLLLDDVTVHADADRTHKILDLLLRVADDRQVIVFTQEEHVASWARERLHEPRHAMRTLKVTTAT
jgi:hypothetical protein